MLIRAIVESSAIQGINYNSESKMLQITFNSNWDKSYDYPDVPLDKVTGFLAADSKGKYYHAHLKQYAK